MKSPTIDLQLLSGYALLGNERLALAHGEWKLLLALTLHRRGIGSERLTELLWPQVGASVARNRLYVALHRLRRRFADELFLRRARSYRLDESCVTVDLWHFAELWDMPEQHASENLAAQLESATNAAALYEIPEWLAPTYRRLEELTQAVVTTLADRALDTGEIERSVRLARRALAFDECDERAWSVLIRSRLLAHDRLGALHDYRTYSRAVMRELQATPAYELAHLLGESGALPLHLERTPARRPGALAGAALGHRNDDPVAFQVLVAERHRRDDALPECVSEDFGEFLNRYERHLRAHFVGNLIEIDLVSLRQ
jgi:DNA-binding SARP family transcriptional activator